MAKEVKCLHKQIGRLLSTWLGRGVVNAGCSDSITQSGDTSGLDHTTGKLMYFFNIFYLFTLRSLWSWQQTCPLGMPASLHSAGPGFSQGCCSRGLLCHHISFWVQLQYLLIWFLITLTGNFVINSLIITQPHIPDPSSSFWQCLTRSQDSGAVD